MYTILYTGYCCDTGVYNKTYEFDTYEEAHTFKESWEVDELGWSDGPDYMGQILRISDIDYENP